MRYFLHFATAVAGMTMGLVLSLFHNGFPPTIETFYWGLGGASLALFMQVFVFGLIDQSSGVARYSPKPSTPIQRTESQGSFTDRMERFAQNVDSAPTDPDRKSKAEFWVDPDLDDYEPTPPKPIGIIRMLLHRIRRILAGR